jgi:hypothetical protein
MVVSVPSSRASHRYSSLPSPCCVYCSQARAASQEAIKRGGFRSSSKLNALMTEIRGLTPGTKCKWSRPCLQAVQQGGISYQHLPPISDSRELQATRCIRTVDTIHLSSSYPRTLSLTTHAVFNTRMRYHVSSSSHVQLYMCVRLFAHTHTTHARMRCHASSSSHVYYVLCSPTPSLFPTHARM